MKSQSEDGYMFVNADIYQIRTVFSVLTKFINRYIFVDKILKNKKG